MNSQQKSLIHAWSVTEPIKQACSVEITKIVVLESFPTASQADLDKKSYMQMCRKCRVRVGFLACFGDFDKKIHTALSISHIPPRMKHTVKAMKDYEGVLAKTGQNSKKGYSPFSTLFCTLRKDEIMKGLEGFLPPLANSQKIL